MADEYWILVVMAGAIALMALIALILFAPPEPSVPPEGAIRIVVKPFSDLEPDPAQVSLGDDIAREFEKSLARYARFDTGPSDGLTPFVLTGQTQKKKGPKRTIRAQVTWDGRQYWSTAFAAKDENRAAATAKAVDALAKKMKVALKHA